MVLIWSLQPQQGSFQHLAQQAQDHYPRAEGMGSTTLKHEIMLFWNQ